MGRSCLEPCLAKSVRHIVPAIHDLVAARAGQRMAPMEDWQRNRALLNVVGYTGVAMIAVAGVDGESGLFDIAVIAENYWHLHDQPRTAWAQEIDLRPHQEPF